MMMNVAPRSARCVGLNPVQPARHHPAAEGSGAVVKVLEQADEVALNLNLALTVAVAKTGLWIQQERAKHAWVAYHNCRPRRFCGAAFSAKAHGHISRKLLCQT